MSNSDIMKKNGGKKFDVVLMNPPYGSTGGDTLHLRFVDKCLDITDKQIVVMPFTFVTKVNHKTHNKYKERFSRYLSEVEEVDSKLFMGTAMPNCGIYVFGDETQSINIKYINAQNNSVASLLDLSEFSDYEKQFIKYLENNNQHNMFGDVGRLNKSKQWYIGKSEDAIKQLTKELAIKSCRKIKKYYDSKNGYALVLNRILGGPGNINFMSGKTGNILNGYDEVLEYCIKRNAAIGYNMIIFKSIKAAQNCKNALQRPLLQFTLFRTQDDQNITIKKCYKYIPDVNWEDPRVKTDEGLLEVCGCPKDKCKEYADYCKKIIEEVDKKK